MSFQITTSTTEPDIVVFHLSGRMAVSRETEALEWRLRAVLRLDEKS